MNESALNTEVRLPRQVKARADRARAIESPNAADDPPAPGVEVVDPPPTAKEVVDAKAEPPAPPADPRENDIGYWKARVKTLDGIMKADRARYKQQVEAMQTELQAARDAIREVELKRQDNAEIDLTEFFTAEEIEVLGEDQAKIQARAIIKQATRIAREQVEREVTPLRKQRKDEEEDAAQEATRKFLARLTELCPHWQQVNVDERWLAYLETVEPNSGFFRQTIIDNAQASGDADRVASMIADFEKTLNPVKVPTDPPIVPSGHGAPAGSPPPPPVTNQGHPSKQEIRNYYKQRTLGKISQEEITAFEARLTAARAAGVL